MSAHIYIDGEIFELEAVSRLELVAGGDGLVTLVDGDGRVAGYAKVGDAAFVTVGEAPIPLSYHLHDDDERDEEEEDRD